jgi:rod shape determining protein RodA
MMFDRRLGRNFDWVMLGLILGLCGIGLITLYSAVTAEMPSPQKIIFYKQLIWFAAGLFIMLVTLLVNYKILDRWAPMIYTLCVLGLVAVVIFGKTIAGSKRWLILGPVSIQPSEIMKIGLIIMLARYYSRNGSTTGFTLRDLILPGIWTFLPFVLIVRQPDLGTAMLLLLIAGAMTVYVKIERRSLLFIGAAGLVSVPLVWFVLKGYQKERILTFLNPDRDPLGAGYHIIQSKIAIGSGMLTGQGYLKGTQNALSFLPEEHTDFIFSVLAEEWGFAGSFLLLTMFFLFLLWALNVANGSRDPFGIILTIGVTAMIFWQFFINIAMVMGLMPVVGVPLPFVSYGGSSTVTVLVCCGLLLSVRMRRFMFD